MSSVAAPTPRAAPSSAIPSSATPSSAAPPSASLANCVIEKLGAGKYSDVFKVKRGTRSVVLKLAYYRDDTVKRFDDLMHKGDVRAARRAKRQDAIAVAAAFAKLSAKLIASKVSPHFVVVYCDADCKSFSNLLESLIPERLAALTATQRKYNNVCLMETMHADMTKYLTKGRYSEHTLRGVLFQVVYTLAALQRLLPGFRHNDLSTNNVLVKKLHGPVTMAYTLGGARYVVPGMRILAALSDYDFTHVPRIPGLMNERVMNGRYAVDARPNASYDTHFFLKSVVKCLAHRRGFPEARAFLDRLALRAEDRQNEEIPALAPALLLRDPYFQALLSSAPADTEYSADKSVALAPSLAASVAASAGAASLAGMPAPGATLPTLYEAAGAMA